jgi:hypothetical protein
MSTIRHTYGDPPIEGTEMTPLTDKQLVDRAIEAYVDWREACIWVNDAYLVWSRQRGCNADFAFGGYTAALDHEERTAACYARVVDRVSDLVGCADAYLQPRPAGATEASGG